MAGLSRIVVDDFSGGSVIATRAPGRLPGNMLVDAENMLLNNVGQLYRRGGSEFLPGSTWPSTQILWVWQGTLAGGARTLVATAADLYSVDGSGVTNISSFGEMAAGAIRPAVRNGIMYLPGGFTYDGTTHGSSVGGYPHWATISNRLVGATQDALVFSGVTDPLTFDVTDFWRLPGGAQTLGLAALRDSAVWFTDQGVFVVSNMALNLTDADGNVQQRLDLYSPDLKLWGIGSAGVVGYEGGLIVPARDGVWLMSLGVTSEVATPLQLLSGSVADFYKDQVAGGAIPGLASVYQGHYLLPIMVSGGATRVLACKLDGADSRGRRTFAWSDLTATTAAPAAAMTPSSDGLSLIGATGVVGGASRLATLNWFDQATGSADADGTTANMTFSTRAVSTGSGNLNTVAKVRSRYRMVDLTAANPELAVFLYDPDSDTHTSVGSAPETTGATTQVIEWATAKRARALEVQITTADPGPVTIESVELLVRESGRA